MQPIAYSDVAHNYQVAAQRKNIAAMKVYLLEPKLVIPTAILANTVLAATFITLFIHIVSS
jgi:hypothetical protein